MDKFLDWHKKRVKKEKAPEHVEKTHSVGKSTKKDGSRKADLKKALEEGVNDVYFQQIEDVLEEISELSNDLRNEGISFNTKQVFRTLEDMRDNLLDRYDSIGETGAEESAPMSVSESLELSESFKEGKMQLDDGKSVTISKDDANCFNELFNNAGSKKSIMIARATKNSKEYKAMLEFAKASKE